MGITLDLEAFCVAHNARLVRMLFLYCGDREVARDVAQDTLAKAVAQWRKVRKLDVPEAWLHRVAINLANSHFRRRKVESRANERVKDQAVHPMGIDTADAVAVRSALSSLSERQRLAILYRYFLDYSVAQAAAAMDCNEGTVKKLTRRAIDSMRPQLAILEVADE